MRPYFDVESSTWDASFGVTFSGVLAGARLIKRADADSATWDVSCGLPSADIGLFDTTYWAEVDIADGLPSRVEL